MTIRFDEPLERPRKSRVLTESRRKSRNALELLDAGHRMEVAFTLSLDAQKLRMAALKAQGFSDREIRSIMGRKNP